MWTELKQTIRNNWRDWLDGFLAALCLGLLFAFVVWVFGR